MRCERTTAGNWGKALASCYRFCFSFLPLPSSFCLFCRWETRRCSGSMSTTREQTWWKSAPLGFIPWQVHQPRIAFLDFCSVKNKLLCVSKQLGFSLTFSSVLADVKSTWYNIALWMLSLCVIPESYRLPPACGTSEIVFFTVLFCGNYGSKTNEDCRVCEIPDLGDIIWV